jgi:membrane-associated protein
MTSIVRELGAVPPWAVLLVVFALPALETSTLLGILVPGELAVLTGGVLADRGHVGLAAVTVAAVAGAVAGDNVGYLLGRRLDPVLRARASEQVRQRLDRGRAAVRRWGGAAILFGRWTAVLRAVIPSAAGLSGFPYRRFLLLNVIGGTTWAVAVTALGFLAGAAYGRAQHSLGLAGIAVLVLVAAGLLGRHLRGSARQAS